MEFRIGKSKIKDNIDVAIIRIAGYHKIPSNSPKSELNFVKPLSLAGYPRFHIYLKETETDYIFNLHLDQKRPVHKGAKAHQADYDSQIIAEEAERIKQKLK
ncbi:MAG: hypothetical protein V1819_03115 [bacterium]